MVHSVFLFLHICSAIVGLLAGWSALVFRKGGRMHRATGDVFAAGMLIMGSTGLCMAVVKGEPGNAVGGMLMCYLAATAWAVVWRKAGEIGVFEYGAAFVGLTAAAVMLSLGVWVERHGPFTDGLPDGPYFAFGTVALLCAISDVRMLVRGGLVGAQRMTRHVARMGLALSFGTISLFLGKQQHFPAALVKSHVLNVPILIVAVVIIYWVIRVRFGKAYKRPGKSKRTEPNLGMIAKPAVTN
jgi:uncharacterized membrane protein